jgi:hypothetical protein
MSDIFREVDEEIRHERYKRLWDRFGPYLIGLAVLIVVATAAYRGWVYWRETEAQASGDVFVQAVRLAEEGKFADAQARLGELADAPGAIRASRGCARRAFRRRPAIRLPPLQVSMQSPPTAARMTRCATLPACARDMSRSTPRISPGAADRLEPLSGDDNALRYLAREGLALGAWKAGNADDARRWIARILDDEGAPSDIATRARTVLDLLNAAEGTPDDKADS